MSKVLVISSKNDFQNFRVSNRYNEKKFSIFYISIIFISHLFASFQCDEDENSDKKRIIKGFLEEKNSKRKLTEKITESHFFHLPNSLFSIISNSSFMTFDDYSAVSFRLSAVFKGESAKTEIPCQKISVKIQDKSGNEYTLDSKDVLFNVNTGLSENYKYNDRIELITFGIDPTLDKIMKKIDSEYRLVFLKNYFPLTIHCYFTTKNNLSDENHNLKSIIFSYFKDDETGVKKNFVAVRLIIKKILDSSENESRFELIPTYK